MKTLSNYILTATAGWIFDGAWISQNLTVRELATCVLVALLGVLMRHCP